MQVQRPISANQNIKVLNYSSNNRESNNNNDIGRAINIQEMEKLADMYMQHNIEKNLKKMKKHYFRSWAR